MIGILFVLALGLALALLLGWGFANLPDERWQMIAAVPTTREEDGQWRGTNLTWYGLFSASALLIAVMLIFILLGALGVSLPAVFVVVALLCGCCLPAARIIAWIVEGKAYAFTVGGASFVGVLLIPWIIVLVNSVFRHATPIPVIPAFSAIAIAYAIGEGVGRLACISFGCCYGKLVHECPPSLRRLFERWSFTFTGATKKIAFCSGLDRHQVVPIQGLTSVVLVATGLVGLMLFLVGQSAASLILVTVVTQLWRVGSELLRADYRGEWKFSAYQMMSLGSVVYVIGIWLFWPPAAAAPADLMQGFQMIWNPLTILFVQALWLAVFVYTGRSMVTGSMMTFHVIKDRI